MKKFLLSFTFLFLLSISYATTFHTITIDGTNDFASDEMFTTTSGNGQTGNVYFTWDAGSIYIGFSGNSGNGNIADDNRALFVYIDTDPQTTPTTGNGTNDRGEWSGVSGTLPFNADFRFVYQTTQSGGSGHNWLPYYWDGSNWAASSIADNSAESNDNFVEYAVSRSDLGNPSQIYICAYSQEQWDGGWIANGIPYDLFTDFTDDNGIHIFNNHWLGYKLDQTGVSPAFSGHDESLPVELSSFVALAGNNRVNLQWVTQSEVNNQGFILERAAFKDGVYEEVTSYRYNPALKGAGNKSQESVYAYVDNGVYNNHTYWYKLIDVDANGVRTEHPVISATPTAKAADFSIIGNKRLPQKYQLAQNYPNPFNPSTSITFDIPKKEKQAVAVELTIFNSLGKQVVRLVHTNLRAGSYRVEWDGKDANHLKQASGVYFYVLRTPDFMSSRKLILIR